MTDDMAETKKYGKYAFILVILATVTFLLFRSFDMPDGDFFHIYNSGRWIVQHNAIPYENYEFVEPGYGTVIQQWLYSICLYGAAQFGYIGVSLFTFIQACLLAFLFYKLSRCIGAGRFAGSVSMLLSVFTFTHYINCRPQIITVILL